MAIGLDLKGYKEILGFWINGSKLSWFWVKVLNDFKAREIKDIFIFSIDSLNGWKKAIELVYSHVDI